MRWTSSISERTDASDAIAEALDSFSLRHEGELPDLLSVHVSGFAAEGWELISDALVDAFPRATLVGCTAEGVLGSDKEIERRPGLALMGASLPGVAVTGFHLSSFERPEVPSPVIGLLPDPSLEPILIAFADPFSCDMKAFLTDLATSHPATPVVGGFASHGRKPGENALFLNGEVHREGLVCVALSGDLRADLLVSQGCRPVGRHYVVTQCEGPWIKSLRGRPTVDVLQDLVSELNEEDLDLARRGLLLGRAIDEYRSDFGRGDFLIQGILGVAPEGGALAVAGEVRLGATVQFHVRDAAAADEDLRSLCAVLDQDYAGAFAFTCNGRGQRMWSEPHHDVRVLQEHFGPLPLTGFFAAGEIGPIGRQNFVHGFTVSAVLFRPLESSEPEEGSREEP